MGSKFVVLVWGSLIWCNEGDAASGQTPLAIEGGWHKTELQIPLEFSRISRDGRLTLVIDPKNGALCKIQYAFSKMTELPAVVENLRGREGVPNVRNIHSATRGSVYSDPLRARVAQWLDHNGFDGAVWTGLPSNYEEKRGCPFTVANAWDYLASLTGITRDKAFHYILNAPDNVDTPLRKVARWPEAIAVHEAGHYVAGILLSRPITKVYICRPQSLEIQSGCEYKEGDSKSRQELDLILSDLAGPWRKSFIIRVRSL